MANTIKIKHGVSTPTNAQLSEYELGYVHNGALYINNGGTITQLTGLAATGLVGANNYLKLPAIAATTSNTGRILVADSTGIVYYKTANNIRSEIGAFASSGGTISGDTTFNKAVTISGLLTANGAIVVDTDSYGNKDPNTAGITGTLGQLYFVVTG